MIFFNFDENNGINDGRSKIDSFCHLVQCPTWSRDMSK